MVPVKLGRVDEACSAVQDYIAKYKRDSSRSTLESIQARIQKALRKR
jgi:hypothetical protein